jgi:penicillin G amidase
MVRARWALGALVLVLVVAGLAIGWFSRRPLPQTDGRLVVNGPHAEVRITRDLWGVPHIFAATDDDAYFGLGFAVAQDRLFQMELLRHVGQGRLAELFGADLVPVDRLFRTMDFQGTGRRRLASARPEVRAAFEAYAHGVNAAVASRGGTLPVEFTLLGRRFEPVKVDDFVGVAGYMAWQLHLSWRFDPVYERLVAQVGPERAAELFPLNGGGEPAIYRGPAAGPSRLALFDLPASATAVLDLLPRFAASNTWAVAASRSTTGGALLANDPHLGLGIPGTWYHAHLSTPTLDVIGSTLPGLPAVVIGHNRDIAWGWTNLMADSGDFFVEKLDPQRPGLVMSHGTWVPLATRDEEIRVKDGPPVRLHVRDTPHGPLVTDLLPGQREAVSYRWAHTVAEESNDFDALYDLDRARSFPEFRAALGKLGAIAQNISYADREGHVGMQTTGAIPRLRGVADGSRFRVGWDGSQEWEGFVPRDQLPHVYDPPEGFVAAANNVTFPSPSPYYISSQWEPLDRILRIREVLSSKPKLSPDDMRALQADVVFPSAVEMRPLVGAAFAGEARPRDPAVARALALLENWDGAMRAESAAAAVFGVFYKHLFHEIFADEMGTDLAGEYRKEANLSAIMMRAVMNGGPARWFDRVGTAAVEDRSENLRAAFVKAVRELRTAWGDDPERWAWGALHTLELKHPLGRVKLLAPYFNLGPVPASGHSQTVNKAEFTDASWAVTAGPSLRQVTDLSNLDEALAIIPAGQSGIPASPHYGDLFPLWRNGEYHPLLMDRGDVERVAAGTLVLVPRP